jgi:hypothetical protein
MCLVDHRTQKLVRSIISCTAIHLNAAVDMYRFAGRQASFKVSFSLRIIKGEKAVLVE